MIYVVIPVYNRIAYTESCLQCLRRQTYPELLPIVVDDGSTDGTSELIAEKYPEVEVIRGRGDWYWTGSAYRGVERALALSRSDQDYILMLNDDLTFDSDLIERLVAFCEKHARSVVQALGSWSDQRNRIQYAGRRIHHWTAGHEATHRGEARDSFKPDYAVLSDVLTGRGVLFPIQVFKEVGNYDLRIIHRGDPEFTKRASKAGWSLWVYFGAVVYSYPVEGKGNINERANFKLKDIKEYFFGALSSAHLPTMWRNARTYTDSFFQAMIFFICHFIRMLFHFIVRLKLHGD